MLFLLRIKILKQQQTVPGHYFTISVTTKIYSELLQQCASFFSEFYIPGSNQ